VVNTIALETWPMPTACVRLDYSRFAFDSSFPHPSLSTELGAIFTLRAPGVTDGEKLAVFGHADPIGEESYNKTLAGRRAKAIYALLTRQPSLWDELHQGAFHGDKWGVESLQTCLTQLGYDVGAIDGKPGPLFRAGIHGFKRDNGLTDDETVDKATRLALFGAYMDALTADEGGTARAYDPADFVGGGKEADSRGAFQGCGERNLAVVLSQDETNELAPDSKREERIRAERPNRRVLIFLFRPNDVKKMSLWPCPAATSGPDGCASVAWSNKDDRLAPSEKRREIRRGGRTFGCKFYDWVARLSPCEAVRGRVKIWLLDESHQRMPNAPYRLRIGSLTREGTANDAGLLVEEEVPLGPSAYLEWAKPDAPGANGAHTTLAFALESPKSEAATAGAADEPPPESPLGALFRGLRDGQFPSYAGLLPERRSSFAARKTVVLSAETADGKTPDQQAQQDAARLQNLSLQPVDPAVSPSSQPFARAYGTADLQEVHTNGVPAGSAPPPGPSVAADATVAPPSCDPLEQPIRTVLAGDPNRAPTHFKNNATYEKTVDKQGDSAPPKDSYTTPLFNFQFLGQWCIPVGGDKQADGKTAVDVSPKRTCTTDPCTDVRQGTSKNFGNALVHVTCKLFNAFVSDPTTTTPTPKAFADWCLIHEGHSGVRGGMSDLHSSGSAIDINASTNPWLPLRNPTARGGERHTGGLSDKDKATPTGQAVMNAYGLQNLDAAITRFNDENVWTPCCDAIDAASKAYYGATADLSERQGGETSRACFTRLALASAALVRYLRLAYGDRGDLKQPMSKQTDHGPAQTYNQLGADQLARFAVSDVVRGYATGSSDLAQLLSHVTALGDPDRTNESVVQSKIDDGVTKLSDLQRSGLADLQTKAMNAHAVLRRGMVHGGLSFYADRASAEAAWKKGGRTTAPSNWTVFETTVPGVFGVVPDWRDPRVGFLNLRVELLEAFDDTSEELFGAKAGDGRNQPGEPHLRWGAVDFGMGGGCSGDLMHFDFNVHDPGTPADPNLAAWRGLQEERRLARVAHAKVAALVKATKLILATATTTLTDVNAQAAKVQATDLAQTITDLSTRLSAISPGCVGKISDKVSSIDQTNGQEYDAIFGSDVSDGPSAQPHRQAIEALLDPAQNAKTNATSARDIAGKLDAQARAAARDTKGVHHQSVLDQLAATKTSIGELERQIQ
jgi:outer membrane protein OmpA-like peptidoglycan-associated protein